MLITALSLAALVLTGLPAAAVDDVQPARAEGPTRLETAEVVAGLSFPQGTAEAVVAGSTTYAGALAGAGLAGALDAPVLLTIPDRLADTTLRALQDLGVERVTIAGGEDEVSAAAEAQLAQHFATTRIGGATPYATAADLARTTRSVNGDDLPTINGAPSVLVASGEDFADALAFSGPAHDGHFPLLLTEGDQLSAEARRALTDIAPAHAAIAGGVDAVSDAVQAEIEAMGIDTTRLGGANRTETATIVADYFVELGYFEARVPLLARGNAFPDALTSASLSAYRDGPILLTATEGLLSEETGQWFIDNCPTIEVLQVVGGVDAVSVEVANGAEELAESCGSQPPPPPVTGQTYEVQPLEALEGQAPTTFDFEVARRNDGQQLTEPLDLILFPCSAADVTGAGPDQFTDADGDGGADGFATTETGQARIAVVNGEDVNDTTAFIAPPDEDGDIDIRLASAEPDCTILVAVNGNGNGQLDVDDQGNPVEPYGVGQARWTD